MRRLTPLIALALSACATSPRPLVMPEGPYGATLETTTQTAVLHQGIDTLLVLYATEETPALREAMAARLMELTHQPREEALRRGGEATRPVEGAAFVLAVHAAQRETNNLADSDPYWSLALETPAGKLVPTAVRRMLADAPLAALFPHIDRQFTAYRVLFPAFDTRQPHTLLVTGAGGTARVAFGAPAAAP